MLVCLLHLVFSSLFIQIKVQEEACGQELHRDG